MIGQENLSDQEKSEMDSDVCLLGDVRGGCGLNLSWRWFARNVLALSFGTRGSKTEMGI